jgi:hypothetical protein
MFSYGSPGLASIAQNIMFLLGLLALSLQGYAFADALRRPAGAFVAAGKQTKQRWLIFLGVATAIGFVSLFLVGVLNFFNLIAVVAAAVYLTDVMPAVRGSRGGSGSSGPYGPW